MKRIALPVLFLLFTGVIFAQHSDAVLGIRTNGMNKHKAKSLGFENPYGSYVGKIYPDSGAEKAGLKPFDYVYAVNDEELGGHNRLSKVLDQYQPGEIVRVAFIRKGQKQEVNLALSDTDDLDMPHRNAANDPFLGITPMHKKVPPGVEGVPVRIIDNSTAQAIGLEDGDILLEIDDYPLRDWHDIDPAINNRNVGDPIAVTFFRNGIVETRSRPIKSSAATHNDHSRPNGPVIVMPEEEVQTLPIKPAEVVLENIAPAELPAVILEETNIDEAASVVSTDNNAVRIRELSYEQLRVFPNPNTGIFDIEFELPDRGDTNVRIFNPNGQVVYQNTLGEFSGMFSDRIDIANSVRGIYFLVVQQDDRSITRKVVLQ